MKRCTSPVSELHCVFHLISPPCSSCDPQGEYKTILQLVGVLSHGKIAKRLTDQAIDLMQDVQNLRKAIYEWVILGQWLALVLNVLFFAQQQAQGRRV